jgi:NAD(P)-dependent dehydrogenase (short-subunit alcohol dehydrogenase family)
MCPTQARSLGPWRAAANDLGRVDIVVANAGIGGAQKPTAEYSDASWHQVIGVNLDGVFYTQRAGIHAMRRNGGDSVINMASMIIAHQSPTRSLRHGRLVRTRYPSVDRS